MVTPLTCEVSQIFSVGEVPLFYSAALPPLTEERTLRQVTYTYRYLRSNELHFPVFYPAIQGIQGTVLAVGSFQGLDLASVGTQAAGLITLNINPMVSLTMALLMNQVPSSASPDEFVATMKKLILPDQVSWPHLERTTPDYRPALVRHIGLMREKMNRSRTPGMNFLDAMVANPRTFLGSLEAYAHAKSLIQGGMASVVYANLFGEDIAALIEGASKVHSEPIRVVYLSNVLDWVRDESMPAEPLLRLLRNQVVDPQGQLLLTMLLREEEPTADIPTAPFLYHAVEIGEAIEILTKGDCLKALANYLACQPSLRPVEIG